MLEYDDLMKFEDAEYQRTLLTTPTSVTSESGIELKECAYGKPSDDVQVWKQASNPGGVTRLYINSLFPADSARSDHQGEQVTSSGLAAETPAGVLLHQADGEVRQQFARGGTHHGTRCISLHLQAQIDTRRAVEQRTVHHDVISAFRAAAP